MHLKRHLSYAQGYLELGLINEAAAELDRVEPPDDQRLDVLTLRMAVLHEQKNWPGLASIAADVVRRDPAEPGGWVTWAYAIRRSVSLPAAEEILLDAEKRHPTEATIQFNLGCYACLRGDLEEAQRRVDRAIAMEPKFLEAAATDPDLEALRAVKSKKRNRSES